MRRNVQLADEEASLELIQLYECAVGACCVFTDLDSVAHAATEAVFGAAVVMWSDNSIPTKVNWVRFPVGSTWDSCRTIPLIGGFFSEIFRFPALSFRCCFILTSLHSHRLSRPRCRLFVVLAISTAHVVFNEDGRVLMDHLFRGCSSHCTLVVQREVLLWVWRDQPYQDFTPVLGLSLLLRSSTNPIPLVTEFESEIQHWQAAASSASGSVHQRTKRAKATSKYPLELNRFPARFTSLGPQEQAAELCRLSIPVSSAYEPATFEPPTKTGEGLPPVVHAYLSGQDTSLCFANLWFWGRHENHIPC
ncbi:hypothetical protein PR048_027950 [Dryococelus australis]|uniref:Uncharacterized protein n=1 Tax=Dryococelus australis TaxID=614101 RepID=A0ABQ9GHX8_9NEOP|nr:hypothetical protein PR048_027950 [Dryococelus australis]